MLLNRRTVFTALACATFGFASAPAPAHADPVGTWKVIGENPDSGNRYTGTVRVNRTGETYSVYWTIDGTDYYGTGIGAKIVKGRFEMGPASKQDTAISVGYISGDSFGMATYFLQADGTWKGVWTYSGSRQVAAEVWLK